MRLSVVRRGLSTGCKSHPLYAIYRNMLKRCYDPSYFQFQDWGGRGIRVCDRWRISFSDFCSDMGPRPDGFWIDRIDNDGNYDPGNCRWVSPKQNNRNRRTTTMVTFQGKSVPLSSLAEQFNIEISALHKRLRLGWPLERALTQPGAREYFVRASGRKRA